MKHLNYLFAIVFLFCIGVAVVTAQTTIQSNGTGGGDWNVTDTWNGGVVPGVLDSVVILSGDSVWVAALDSCDGLNVMDGATLAMYTHFSPNNITLEGTMIAYADTIFERGLVTVGSNAVYKHDRDGGRFPIATWLPGSELLITGVTANVPVNRNQNFYNFTWNCPNQTSNLSMSWDSVTIGGDVNILRTGTTARWYFTTALGGDSAVLTVNGNVNVVRGSVSSNGTGNGATRFVITILGDINVIGEDPSRDSCNFSVSRGSQGSGTGTTTWYLYGNFTFQNAISQNSNPNGAKFVFVKPGTQMLSVGPNDSLINFPIEVAAGTTLDMGTSIIPGSGHITIDSGATLMTANSGGIDAIFPGTGNKVLSTYSSYTFNGSSAQVTGGLMPDVLNNLTIDNSSGVTLSDPISVTGTLSVMNGDFLLSGNLVTLESTATLNESAGNTAIGTITTSRDVFQSTDETFGGIGLAFNAADAAPGMTTVTRITGTAQTYFANESILRWFDVTPTVNTGLNAQLDYFYDASELNGQDENTLDLWQSNDAGSTWSSTGSTLNTGLKRLRASGLASLSRFAAADSANAMNVGSVLYHMRQSWNMISLPVMIGDAHKSAVFPTAISSAFKYNGGYFVDSILSFGVGYWLKFPSDEDVAITGTPITLDTLTLIEGWNMVGTISDSISASSVVEVPDGIITSPFFGYNSGYIPSDNLIPAHAYWVKGGVGGGQIILSSTGLSKADANSSEQWEKFNSVTITDKNGSTQTLYLGNVTDENQKSTFYEMPPLPPVSVFDARFTSQKFAETYPAQFEGSKEYRIALQSAVYPVTVQWNLTDGSKRFMLSTSEKAGMQMNSSGSTVIRNSDGTIKITVSGDSRIPGQYSLSKNYPNPFNPSTTFNIGLPNRSQVSLKVFNILGVEIAELASGVFDGGVYTFQWNGRNTTGAEVSSGVYFYRLDASSLEGREGYSQIQKMLLAK